MYDEFPAPLLFKIPNKKYEIRNKVESRKAEGGIKQLRPETKKI